MASGIAKAVALPRRLSLGRQCQSLHIPSRGAKKGRRSDARVSNELATTFEAEVTLLSICGNARFHFNILG